MRMQSLFKRLTVLIVLTLIFKSVAFSQYTTQALRVTEKIKPDGVLSEPAWQLAQDASDFIGFYPVFGKLPAQQTVVKVLYDNHSIYFAAIMYDNVPDSIYSEFTERDKDNGNVDYFGISLNPNNDGQNTYEFIISAANVQTDIRVANGNDDYKWDAVWYSGIKITEDGWIAEIEIPYSAIRFPKTNEQLWAVNFFRTVRRSREKSSWTPVDLSKGSEASQMGTIQGMRNIDSPLRLALMPYVSGYVNSYDSNVGYSFSGGLDLKLGLSETYTLDMTLIPDFGQTKTDDLILNLKPQETYYSENRPFFTEGTELFTKCGLFYSRRIGKNPELYGQVIENSSSAGYEILKNPSTARLVNAFKISGRGKNNLAVGVFNAVTANTWAKIAYEEAEPELILTEPAANYNMFVLDQTIGKNSYVNFTNASVVVPGNKYLSNVSASSVKIMEKKNRYGVSALVAYSMQRNNSSYLADGWYINSSAGKLTGTWVYYLSSEIITDKYNPNDMGYLTEFNQVSNTATVGYRKYSQFWIFNESRNSLSFSYNTLFRDAAFTKAEVYLSNYATTRKHLSLWNEISWQPVDYHDYYEPRDGVSFYKRPAMFSEFFMLSTDYRKKLAVDFRTGYYGDTEERHGVWGNISPLARAGKRFSIRYTLGGDWDLAGAGYFTRISDTIVFGRRDVITFTNTLNFTYVFTNKLSLSFRARHYVSSVDYKKFYNLNPDGTLSYQPDYSFDGDYVFNLFNVDMLVSWNFLPGSYLSVMWKNQIFASGNVPTLSEMPGYFENFKSLWIEPQANNLSLKLIYYLDYQSVVRGG
jgi:hypothetical protein